MPMCVNHLMKERKEGHVLLNDALNTFYSLLYGKEMFYFNDALNTFYILRKHTVATTLATPSD